MRPLPSTRTKALVTVACAALLVAAGCSTGARPSVAGEHGKSTSGQAASGPTTSTTLPAVAVLGTPGDNATNVALDSPIVVKAADGILTNVEVNAVRPEAAVTTAEAGDGPTTTTAPFVAEKIPGGFSTDKTVWLGGRKLRAGTTYQVTAVANGPDHRQTLKYWKFTTLTPATVLHTRLNVFEGATYGVGMPVIVQLTSPVDPSLRKAVEQRISMTTSTNVQGSWRWFTNSELHWRPAQYWPAGTKATLAVDFGGLNAGNDVWGVDGRTVNFAIGDAHVSTVDANTHQMTVTTNGAIERTIPVSTGRDKYPTKSGIHVVMTREPTHHMDSSTIGIPSGGPGGYNETVKWAERISNSGEFVHSAPWSVGSQGSDNVSHGCVNVSNSDGEWFFDYSLIGDVVNVVGTPATLAPDNGYGDWQIPYDQWAN